MGLKIRGQEITPRQLSARHFLEYEKRKITQSPEIANEWLTREILEGSGVAYEQLRFRDHGRVLSWATSPPITFNDNLPLEETEDFTVGNNRFTEKDDSGDAFGQFIVRFNKNQEDAYLWGIPRVLLMNGQAIAPDALDKPISEGGLDCQSMAVITRWLQGFLL